MHISCTAKNEALSLAFIFVSNRYFDIIFSIVSSNGTADMQYFMVLFPSSASWFVQDVDCYIHCSCKLFSDMAHGEGCLKPGFH